MIALPAQNLHWTRLLLIVSAAIALLAVGMSVFRSKESERSPAIPEKAGGIDEIIEKLEERLKQDPSRAEGWRLLGWTYFESGRPADSARAYRRALALEPGQAELWSALGESLLLASQNGFPAEAHEAFEKAFSLDPKNVRARFFLGVAKAENGDAKGAIEDWQALLADAPADAPWVAAVRQKIQELAAAKGVSPALSAAGEPKR